jgi:hypothetical protein
MPGWLAGWFADGLATANYLMANYCLLLVMCGFLELLITH